MSIAGQWFRGQSLQGGPQTGLQFTEPAVLPDRKDRTGRIEEGDRKFVSGDSLNGNLAVPRLRMNAAGQAQDPPMLIQAEVGADVQGLHPHPLAVGYV